MPTRPATLRLSPKVRRLLAEHRLEARSIAGTGAHGRVTPGDVARAAGVPRAPADGRVLASPAARRLLRDAGTDLAAAARANDGRRLTRADAAAVVAHRSQTAREAPTRDQPHAPASVEVDVAQLLARIAAGQSDFAARNGFELPLEVALAAALASVLVRRPELAASSAPQGAGDGRAYPGVHVGFLRAGEDAPDVTVVPDVHYLTVAGLARRARAAGTPTAGTAPATTTRPTLIVGADATVPEDVVRRAELGVLTISSPSPHRVTSTDQHGHEVVHTRPHVTVRLHHDERTAPDDAAALLAELGATVTSWALPVGP